MDQLADAKLSLRVDHDDADEGLFALDARMNL